LRQSALYASCSNWNTCLCPQKLPVGVQLYNDFDPSTVRSAYLVESQADPVPRQETSKAAASSEQVALTHQMSAHDRDTEWSCRAWRVDECTSCGDLAPDDVDRIRAKELSGLVWVASVADSSSPVEGSPSAGMRISCACPLEVFVRQPPECAVSFVRGRIAVGRSLLAAEPAYIGLLFSAICS
jgi:hypothetical protein